jgi:cyclohexanone monooxygenase
MNNQVYTEEKLKEVRKKYLEERDKRLREDANQQWNETSGDFSYFVDDPYINQNESRASLKTKHQIVIIGAGFGGMLAAARLTEAGFDDILIIEKAGGFGGTWYWNRYPGAYCDVESYVYLPMLEETGFVPKEKYTNATECLEYCNILANRYGLFEKVIFQTEVVSNRWHEEKKEWIVETDKQDTISAQFIVHSNGPLNRPKLPGIEGINNFKGHTFHTSRWDYQYTGGSSSGELSNLNDKKVAVIGTGATAIQCIPHLGAAAKALYVFQRTPSAVDIRNNRLTDIDWLQNQEAGWQAKRRKNYESIISGMPVEEDLVDDGWTEAFKDLFAFMQDHDLLKSGAEGIAKAMEIADLKKMEKIRNLASDILDDQETAENLKPYYRWLCKRPCFNDDYLKTYNLPNAHLIDTNGKGVTRITPNGVVANDIEYEVDCIIFATGFEVGTDYSRRAGYGIYGRGGLNIEEKFSMTKGYESLFGMHAKEFPNSFFFGIGQTGFSSTYTYALDEQAIQLSYLLSRAREMGAKTIEPTQEAVDEWVQTIIEKARVSKEFQENCTPGYYNLEGAVNQLPQNNTYGGGPIEFFDLMEEWRREGNLKGLELK